MFAHRYLKTDVNLDAQHQSPQAANLSGAEGAESPAMGPSLGVQGLGAQRLTAGVRGEVLLGARGSEGKGRGEPAGSEVKGLLVAPSPPF